MNNSKIKAIYSLTPMQEGMLYHSIMAGNAGTDLVQMKTSIVGKFEVDIFEESINRLIVRHETLRTIFLYEGLQEPKQVVLQNSTLKVHYEEITYMSEEKAKEYIEDYLFIDRNKKMNLTKGGLFRVAVFKVEKDRYEIIITFHHIILDGWSVGIILDELYQIYDSILLNRAIELQETVNVGNYMKWLKTNTSYNESMYYWKNLLKNYTEYAEIPKTWTNYDEREYKRKDCEYIIPENIVSQVKKVAAEGHITLGTFIHTVWGILLQQYSNSNDVVFGTVVSGRNSMVEEVERIVGMLINTIPIRVTAERDTTFWQLAKLLQQELLESEKHAYLQLADIQSLTKLRKKLINHVVAFENYHVIKTDNVDRDFEIKKHVAYEQTNYDFSIVFIPGDTIKIKITYNSKAYSEQFIESIHCHISNIINAVLDNPNLLISDIRLMDDKEKNKLIYEFNDTSCDYANEKLVHQLFEEKADLYPDKCALTFRQKKMSYAELNKKANQLAHLLRTKKINAAEPVAILMERSMELVWGIVAVLKANGMYVPFDISHPVLRIVDEIEDLAVSKIIVTPGQIDLLKQIMKETDKIKQVYVLGMDNLNEDCFFGAKIEYYSDNDIQKCSQENLENIINSDDRAYVIYTSGSTGKPKGVVVPHKPVVNMIDFFTKSYGINRDDSLLFVTSICFDLSVYDIWGMLAVGGTVEIVPAERLADHPYIMNRLCSGDITIWDSAPSFLQQFMPMFKDYEEKGKRSLLRKVFIGGDWIDINLSDEMKKIFPKVTVTALGGATEATIYSNYFEIDKIHPGWVSIPYGKPIQNAWYYILDSNMEPVPIGIRGDLYIGGECLAQGYINDEKLTAERFLDNPFVQNETKIYKTGDCARWYQDGNIEFLGRKDFQVKIRGYRIETGEIEAHLKNYEGIRDVIVEARVSENKDKYLAAYYVATEEIDSKKLGMYLRKFVPEYMIPSFFVQLQEFPLNNNGKLDRKALPEPQSMLILQRNIIEPENENQRKILAIWSEILNIPKEDISIEDNFFDIGGHSLLAVKLEVELQRKKLITSDTDEMFQLDEYSTIRAIDQFITGKI